MKIIRRPFSRLGVKFVHFAIKYLLNFLQRRAPTSKKDADNSLLPIDQLISSLYHIIAIFSQTTAHKN
jgi:hypothetical protein